VRDLHSAQPNAPRYPLNFNFRHHIDGMRLAKLQLRIVWEEMLRRFDRIELVGKLKRVYSSLPLWSSSMKTL
jgi:cytochrome P450